MHDLWHALRSTFQRIGATHDTDTKHMALTLNNSSTSSSLEGGGVEPRGNVPEELRLAAHDFGAAVRHARVFFKVRHPTLLVLGSPQL